MMSVNSCHNSLHLLPRIESHGASLQRQKMKLFVFDDPIPGAALRDQWFSELGLVTSET